MIYQQLPPFNPVANGVRSTLQVPRYTMTLGRVVLDFAGAGNSITKATISEVVMKVGARVVFGPITGAELDRLNKYRGLYDQADHLTIDLTERDGLSVAAKEIGGIDIPALGGDDIFVEIVNSASSGTPTLRALAGFTGLQFDPDEPKKNDQMIHKVLKYQVPTSGGTLLTWMPNFRGAAIKRVHFLYTGPDWTAAANGNLQRVECKRNGIAVWDKIECRDARFLQMEQRKVPQPRTYTVDFIADNVNSAALRSAKARTLEFNLTLGAADTIQAIVEALDLPNNL